MLCFAWPIVDQELVREQSRARARMFKFRFRSVSFEALSGRVRGY